MNNPNVQAYKWLRSMSTVERDQMSLHEFHCTHDALDHDQVDFLYEKYYVIQNKIEDEISVLWELESVIIKTAQFFIVLLLAILIILGVFTLTPYATFAGMKSYMGWIGGLLFIVFVASFALDTIIQKSIFKKYKQLSS